MSSRRSPINVVELSQIHTQSRLAQRQPTWLPMHQDPSDHVTSPESSLIAVWSDSQDPRSGQTGLIHIPQCILDIRSSHDLPKASRSSHSRGYSSSSSSSSSSSAGQEERVAIPRYVIQAALSRLVPPCGGEILNYPHFDDDEDWVFSRCYLADFTGFDEQRAATLSAQGRLCCWASMVLVPCGEGESERQSWDLCFMVHRVMVHQEGKGGVCGQGCAL